MSSSDLVVPEGIVVSSSSPTTTGVVTATGGGGSNTPVKERQSLTLEQRRALRRWAGSQPNRPSHKQCIEWFQTQYNQIISQSTVSHSLSPKYARLDGDPQLSGSRLRLGNWPDVEKLVLLWHQQMVNAQGRTPSNDELAEKAKMIFQQLPRYKDDDPPEFSPGWIHRFKKRYGLLIRRQRRHGSLGNDGAGGGGNNGGGGEEDVSYLVEALPRFMGVVISPDTSPAVVRDAIQRMIGIEHGLGLCARVRDEICLRQGGFGSPQQQQQQQQQQQSDQQVMYGVDEDPEVVLQNALRAMQEAEADAEAQAALVREERERAAAVGGAAGGGMGGGGGGGCGPLGQLAGQAYAQHAAAAAVNAALATTPIRSGGGVRGGGGGGGGAAHLQLTPIPSDGPVSSVDQPVRCPFCVNQRMLRTIKEAVEHLSTHVIV